MEYTQKPEKEFNKSILKDSEVDRKEKLEEIVNNPP